MNDGVDIIEKAENALVLGTNKVIDPYINPCCQICPAAFARFLETTEYTKKRKKTIYNNFHAWHSHHYYKGKIKKDDPRELDSFLEVEAKPPAPATSMLSPGQEPCCFLCPGGFDQVERMAKADLKSGMSFLEEDARLNFLGGPGKNDKDKDFCCRVCAAQFYPPRDYFDYETLMNTLSVFVEEDETTSASSSFDDDATMQLRTRRGEPERAASPTVFVEERAEMSTSASSKKDDTKTDCCVACKKKFYSGVSKSKYYDPIEERKEAELGWWKKMVRKTPPVDKEIDKMHDMSPRDPENKRDYKAGTFSALGI